MSSVANPFGLRPLYHPTGLERAKAYRIDSAYTTAIFKYGAVILNTNGTIVVGTAAADLLGVLAGVEFTDGEGRRRHLPGWPSGGVPGATDIVAWVWDDPEIVFEIQANGSVAQAAIGDQADLVNPGSGTASTFLSTSAMSSTLAGAGVQAQLRIVEFGRQTDNAPGDAFTVVGVKIARNQFIANKVAI